LSVPHHDAIRVNHKNWIEFWMLGFGIRYFKHTIQTMCPKHLAQPQPNERLRMISKDNKKSLSLTLIHLCDILLVV